MLKLISDDIMNILIDDIPVNLQQMVDIIGMDKLIEL